VVSVLVVGAQGVATAGGWETDLKNKEMKLQTKEVKGSGIEAVRGVMDVPWTPGQVAEVVFSDEAQAKYLVGVKKIKLLGDVTTKAGARVRTVYQRMEYPAIDDRDVVLKFVMSKKAGPSGDVWTIKFDTVNVKAAQRDGVIRIAKLKGGWTISPHPSGTGSRVVYTCHVEIGGNVPDFLVNSGQIDNLERMLTVLRAEIATRHGG
jgi:hypothetical protein